MLDGLRVSPHQVIRYSYGGLLFILLAALFEPATTKTVIDALGPVISVFITFSIGAGVYVLFKNVLGEGIVFPFTHAVHFIWDYLRRRRGKKTTSIVQYLSLLGVPLGSRRAAYRAVRNEFLGKPVINRLELAHAELYILYLTAIEFLGASLVFNLNSKPSSIFLIVGAIAFVSAVIGDINQHQQECHYAKALNSYPDDTDGKVVEYLRNRGFIPQQKNKSR